MQRRDKDKPAETSARPEPKKAYRNLDFLESTAARSLRILSEYLEPDARFKRYKIDDTIIFFGSARILPREEAEKRLAAAQAEGHACPVASARCWLRPPASLGPRGTGASPAGASHR